MTLVRVERWDPAGEVLRRRGRPDLIPGAPYAFAPLELTPWGSLKRPTGTGVATSGDTVTDALNEVRGGDAVVVWSAGASNLTAGTTYYVRDRDAAGFKLAATRGGPALALGTATITYEAVRTVGCWTPGALMLDLATAGTTVTATRTPLVNGDTVTVVERKGTTAVTIGTVYYVRDRAGDAFGVTTFALAATAGGAAITLGAGTIGLTTLEYHAGDLTINTPGEVHEGLYVDGRVVIGGSGTNATVTGCVARGPVTGTTDNAIVIGGASLHGRGLVMRWCTLAGRRGIPIEANPTTTQIRDAHKTWCYVDGVRLDQATIEYCEITGTVDGVALIGSYGGMTIRCNHIHTSNFATWYDSANGVKYTGYPAQTDFATHNDGIQAYYGAGHLIEGNNLGGRQSTISTATVTANNDPWIPAQRAVIDQVAAAAAFRYSALMLTTAGTGTGGIFRRNIVQGGTASLNLVGKTTDTLAGWQVVENRVRAPQTGYRILKTAATAATISGNVWDDTGAAVDIATVG